VLRRVAVAVLVTFEQVAGVAVRFLARGLIAARAGGEEWQDG
jgi:hypothetical protein